MKFNFKIIFCGLLLLTSLSAHARYFFEPHVAFIISGSSDAPSEPTYTGPSYGVRLGYYEKQVGFNYGLNFTRSSYNYSNDTVASVAYKKSDIGVFFGYNSTNQYRLWTELAYTKQSQQSDYYSGHTIEFGFGYAVSEKVSLNIYYRLPKFTSLSTDGSKSSLNPAIGLQEIVAGVSFPLEL